jgi:hypothetical protein
MCVAVAFWVFTSLLWYSIHPQRRHVDLDATSEWYELQIRGDEDWLQTGILSKPLRHFMESTCKMKSSALDRFPDIVLHAPLAYVVVGDV